MLSPGAAPASQTRPFLAATAQFASGDDTPRAYLERCLEALATRESKIGAFVQIRIDDARVAADASTARRDDGKPLSANMADPYLALRFCDENMWVQQMTES